MASEKSNVDSKVTFKIIEDVNQIAGKLNLQIHNFTDVNRPDLDKAPSQAAWVNKEQDAKHQVKGQGVNPQKKNSQQEMNFIITQPTTRSHSISVSGHAIT